MPPPGALKRSSWEKHAASLFYDAAAEHVYTTSFIWQFSSSGNIFGVVASTTRRDICRPTGGQEWVEENILNATKHLDVRRNRTDKSSWRFCRVGSFVELEVLVAKMMSSFDSCQVLLSPNCRRRILHMNYRLRYKNLAYNAGECTR